MTPVRVVTVKSKSHRGKPAESRGNTAEKKPLLYPRNSVALRGPPRWLLPLLLLLLLLLSFSVTFAVAFAVAQRVPAVFGDVFRVNSASLFHVGITVEFASSIPKRSRMLDSCTAPPRSKFSRYSSDG